MSRDNTVIVGAGLAGLACGVVLKERGIPFVILEASDSPGGRVKTDQVDGYLLDRGFQVLLKAYPEAQNFFDYGLLKLKTFKPGALIRHDKHFYTISDPFRDPLQAFNTLRAPIGNFHDKLNVAALRAAVTTCSLSHIAKQENISTLEFLQRKGFTEEFIDQFFRPFFGGVFMERELSTSSVYFQFLFRMFALGDTAVPEQGMVQLALQLANKIGTEHIRLNSRVVAVNSGSVVLSNHEQIEAANIVIATESTALETLLPNTEFAAMKERSVTCLYFACDKAPISEAILVLNGEKEGPINNLCVPSNVSATYAPEGKALVSVTVLGDSIDQEQLQSQVRVQLVDWYGTSVTSWRHLRTYRIKHALPANPPAEKLTWSKANELPTQIFVCGDHTSSPSIHGALQSGRAVAELIAKQKIVTSN